MQYYFNIPKERIIHSGEKYKHTKDGILIDDHAKHIIEHVNYNNNLGFLFNLNNSFGWNTLEEKHPLIKEVSSYGEILDQLSDNIVKINKISKAIKTGYNMFTSSLPIGLAGLMPCEQ